MKTTTLVSRMFCITAALLITACASSASAQQSTASTTDHYRFANTYDMGRGRNSFGTTWERIWNLYNTNMQPAIDTQAFFDMLLQEQDSSGRYRNDEDINFRAGLLGLELDEDIRLTDFMDRNGQNVAVMYVQDAPMVEYAMVYKVEGAWRILFFNRTFTQEYYDSLLGNR